MDKYMELKAEYEELLKEVQADLPGADVSEELLLFYMAASLKIWGSNLLYSPDYAKLLCAVSGTPYTLEQVVTAMGCCADAERRLKIPDFIKKLVEQDKRCSTGKTMQVLRRMSSLFVGTAMVNGDFTVEEAGCLSEIMRTLIDFASNAGLRVEETPDFRDKITEKKEDSYLQNDELASAAVNGVVSPARTDLSVRRVGADGTARTNFDDFRTDRPVQPREDPSLPVNITINLSPDSGAADFGIHAESTETQAFSHSEANTPRQEPGGESMEALLAELDGLVGLANVKQDVHSLMNFIKVTKMREARGMKVPTISYHLVFTGNPGTGKTTVARLVAKLYYQMGLLPKGQLVETDRSALVAGYLGQTAIKTQKVIQQAMGGVLFVDEAYSLAGETDDSYGREAIETILKAMEDHRDELVVIVAGYTELMHKFIASNPGLNSRFSKYFEFPDYTGDELVAIFERFCETNGYVLEQEALRELKKKFDELYENRDEHFGNARTVRNIFEKAINMQADRIAVLQDITDEDLANITMQDVLAGMGGDCS